MAAAKTPSLFAEDRQPDSDYLAIPITSSERRRYIPMGYMSKEIIASKTIIADREEEWITRITRITRIN